MRLRAIALPAEHGSWGFTLEPIFLGLLVAPSLAGTYLALAIFAAFLTRQPLRVALVDRRRGQRLERTALAERVGLIYVTIAVLGFAATVWSAGLIPFLPLALATPALAIFLHHDLQRRGRDLLPEVAGPVAMASVASSIALAGGWALPAALALWFVLAARAVPAVLYVRSRIRMARGVEPQTGLALAAHVVGLVLVAVLVWVELLPALAIAAFVILLLRALYCLSPYCPTLTPRTIGFSELGLGVLTVLLVVAGYIFGV